MPPAETSSASSLLADSLRQALRGLAKSVVIITTIDSEGRRHAMAATAVTPVSMAPPSMLFCINRDASSYSTLLAGADFCINVLAFEHLDLAHLCGGGAKGEARFNTGAWEQDEAGVPYLRDAQASVICAQDQRIAYGTHDIFIGRVRKVAFSDGVNPLIFANGAYKRIAD
jgi:flavin reductase (DIM6/NTAB) family NADH-FMN oxidoreductase RutF